LIHLSPRIRGLFVFSGTVYVGGALIVEAISANRWYVDGGVTFPYLAIGTVEELFEMLGIALFIYALMRYLVEMETTAVFSFGRASNPGGRSVPWRTWHLGAAAALLIGINGALYAWASNQQGNGIANEPAPAPFARTIINRYAGQGVVALQINEPLEPENAAAPAIASSLLTLFEEVLVVALPGERTSVAFAGQQLPFGRSVLSDALQQSGEEQFAILDTAALRNLAAGRSTTTAVGE
jgi:hypothetical protein